MYCVMLCCAILSSVVRRMAFVNNMSISRILCLAINNRKYQNLTQFIGFPNTPSNLAASRFMAPKSSCGQIIAATTGFTFPVFR